MTVRTMNFTFLETFQTVTILGDVDLMVNTALPEDQDLSERSLYT